MQCAEVRVNVKAGTVDQPAQAVVRFLFVSPFRRLLTSELCEVVVDARQGGGGGGKGEDSWLPGRLEEEVYSRLTH